MFDNGTNTRRIIEAYAFLLSGSGVVNSGESRLTSDLFRFSTNSIKADTSIIT